MKRIQEGSIVTWNGFYYGKVLGRKTDRYYRSHTARFDNSMGGTEEISVDEYFEVAQKYATVMYGR